MSNLLSIQAKAVDKVVKAAAKFGVPANSLFEASGLTLNDFVDPDNRIPFRTMVALYENGALLTGDQAFGLHVGEAVDPRAFDVLGYSVINSPTFGAGLDRMVRYNSLWTNGSAFDVEISDPNSRIIYNYLDRSIVEHRHDAEMTFAAIVTLGRKVMTGATHWSPVRVSFQHHQPADTTEHQRIFDCPVSFGSAKNEFVFDSSALARPLAKADPGLCAVLDRHAKEMLAKFPGPEDSLLDRTRTLIKDELSGGDASLNRLAAKLGMSGRTLQRKLREQGTSHQELLDEMRRDLAIRYLREPEMAICEVAYLLGFSESSALHRAFKRWTGMTPSEFRR
ncbi:MAG TPA: AraC family transcriptional regulator [Pyrinomonadaceae bacterium]|nr:AraC family transcriptional regulator [Pyrinomonadaceae bacterium]